MDLYWDWNTFASIVTAIGVLVAAWQLRESRAISQTTFEDMFDQQYRALTMVIPVDALIGVPIAEADMKVVREHIYNYLDLCNEQVFLRTKGRIRKARWSDWCEGMRGNLVKPAFASVWAEMKLKAPGEFSALTKLEALGFKCDPRSRRFRTAA